MGRMQLKKTVGAIRRKVGVDRLEKREKLVLFSGVIFVIAFIVFQSMIIPYLDARETMIRSLKKNETELVDIQLLRKEYLELKSRQGDIEKRLANRASGFSLFSFIEEQAAATRVKDQVTYMKPSSNEIDEGFNESIVEMKVEQVSLEQLVSFLRRVESEEKIVSVQRISIQESGQDDGLLDTVINIKTFESKKS